MIRTSIFVVAAIAIGSSASLAVADLTPQALPFSQNWSNTGLITANDDWSGVPGVIGYRGDDLTLATGTDPQTLTADAGPPGLVVDVLAQTVTTNITGGVGEMDGLPNPVVALQGSGTADAPSLVITVNTTLLFGITISYDLRDVDGTTDNATQPVALQWRTGGAGPWTNVPAGFVADASSGPSLDTLVTPVSVLGPAGWNNQSNLQFRIITTNAVGSDEWIGVDNISVTPEPTTLALLGLGALGLIRRRR
jgi:uncharacterized protein